MRLYEIARVNLRRLAQGDERALQARLTGRLHMSQQRREQWSVALGRLLDLPSDAIVRTISLTGLDVNWSLSERDNYSHATRRRAYLPRIQAAYKALDQDERQAVVAVVDRELARLLPQGEDVAPDLQLRTVGVPRPTIADGVSPAIPNQRRVFVVHGRDLVLRDAVFVFLRAVGLEPLEWSQAMHLTGSASPYIGEVLDAAFAEAQAIVVLLTPDDEVRLTPPLHAPDEPAHERHISLQPRANVIFEAGMGFGRSPDRTVLVQLGEVKTFSDIAGRHVLRLTNDESRRRDFIARLTTAGCAVTTDGDWQAAGDFSIERPLSVGPSTAKAETSPPPSEGPLSVEWVDEVYPQTSGLTASLEALGYIVQWIPDGRLAAKLDLEGWSLVTREGVQERLVLFKLKAQPEDQTLIKKKRLLTDDAVRWTPEVPLNRPRAWHAGVAHKRKIYVVGGIDDVPGSIMERTRYNTGEWASAEIDGSISAWHSVCPLTTARSGASAFASDRYFYLLGGETGELGRAHSGPETCFTATIARAAFQVDGSLAPWEVIGRMNVEQWGFSVVTIGSDIYALGGNDGTASIANVRHARLDANGLFSAWRDLNPMTVRRWAACAVHVNGYLYVFGGQDGEYTLRSIERARILPDGSLGAWQVAGVMTDRRHGATAVVVRNSVVICGGYSGSGAGDTPADQYLASLELAPIQHDGTLGAWQAETPMRSRRGYHVSVVVDDWLYVIGGASGDNFSPSVERIKIGALA